MNDKDKCKVDENFWPLKPKWSVVSTIGLLITILLIVAFIKKVLGWPSDKSENTVLIGVLIISLLPIFLSVIDLLIKHKGTFEYKGIKLDFSVVKNFGTFGFEMPANIENENHIFESKQDAIVDVLDALSLSHVSEHDVIVIDIGKNSWWETRLLIVLTGASRLQKSTRIVFLNSDYDVENNYIGWGFANELLRELLSANQNYKKSFYRARAAATQLELLSPDDAHKDNQQSHPPWIQEGSLADKNRNIALDYLSETDDRFLVEKLLFSEVKENFEDIPKIMTLENLKKLFCQVLKDEQIDQNWSDAYKQDSFFRSQESYIAITQHGKYQSLVPKLEILTQMFKSMQERK